MASFSLTAFFKKWLGKSITRWSSSDYGQCVDLVRQYLYERFGDAYHGIPKVGRAHDMYEKADTRKWRKVRNTPAGVPPAGAIVIMHTGNPNGHVCIARSGSTQRVCKTQDENWSKPHRVTYEDHGYAQGVYGWLIPR